MILYIIYNCIFFHLNFFLYINKQLAWTVFRKQNETNIPFQFD